MNVSLEWLVESCRVNNAQLPQLYSQFSVIFSVLDRIRASNNFDINDTKSSIQHDVNKIYKFLKDPRFTKAFELYKNLMEVLLPVTQHKGSDICIDDINVNSTTKELIRTYNSISSPTQINNVKLVRIKRSNLPLGVTISIDPELELPMVQRIIHGGLAHRLNLLNRMDCILEINNESLKGFSLENVHEYIQTSMEESVSMLIRPGECHSPTYVEQYWKSNVSYQPQLDKQLPCVELGMALTQGQVMRVVDTSDADYWQVESLDSKFGALARLVPSSVLQELRWGIPHDDKSVFRPYEPVVQYIPKPDRKRLVLIVCSFKLDIELLCKQSNLNDVIKSPERFYYGEKNGGTGNSKLPKHVFESDIIAGRFVDVEWHGRKPVSGVTFESVRNILFYDNKICILQICPEVLYRIRHTDLFPYVIFISTQNHKKQKNCFNMSLSSERIPASSVIATYGYLFDEILMDQNKIIQAAFDAQRKPCWVCPDTEKK